MGLHAQLLSKEDKQKEIQKVKDFIKKKRYPKVDFSKIIIRFTRKGKNFMGIVSVGPKGGETKIALDDGSGLRKDFLEKTYVKDAIGPTAEKIIAQENATIRESRKRL